VCVFLVWAAREPCQREQRVVEGAELILHAGLLLSKRGVANTENLFEPSVATLSFLLRTAAEPNSTFSFRLMHARE